MLRQGGRGCLNALCLVVQHNLLTGGRFLTSVALKASGSWNLFVFSLYIIFGDPFQSIVFFVSFSSFAMRDASVFSSATFIRARAAFACPHPYYPVIGTAVVVQVIRLVYKQYRSPEVKF